MNRRVQCTSSLMKHISLYKANLFHVLTTDILFRRRTISGNRQFPGSLNGSPFKSGSMSGIDIL
jgi:hypothetical protein